MSDQINYDWRNGPYDFDNQLQPDCEVKTAEGEIYQAVCFRYPVDGTNPASFVERWVTEDPRCKDEEGLVTNVVAWRWLRRKTVPMNREQQLFTLADKLLLANRRLVTLMALDHEADSYIVGCRQTPFLCNLVRFMAEDLRSTHSPSLRTDWEQLNPDNLDWLDQYELIDLIVESGGPRTKANGELVTVPFSYLAESNEIGAPTIDISGHYAANFYRMMWVDFMIHALEDEVEELEAAIAVEFEMAMKEGGK